jgi:hypothetical protein
VLITKCSLVRVLPAPPRSGALPEISRKCSKGPDLAGFSASAVHGDRHAKRLQGFSILLSPAAQNPFLADIQMLSAATLMRQPEHGMLPRPFCWRVAQPSDADAMRKSAIDGGPHKVRRKEGE